MNPTDWVWLCAAFALGGAIVAIAGKRPLPWAVVVPGLWLPVHLLTAVLPAIISGGSDGGVRADPPPTAAFVPLSMVVGAMFGGVLVRVVRGRLSEQSHRDRGV